MKNVYLLPTDKPSRLYSSYGILEDLSYGKTFTIVNEEIAKINLHKDLKEYQEKLIKANWKSENIYITNDEEIKVNDYALNPYCKEFLKCTESNRISIQEHWYKIILTTDQDLIKDGVQAIYDEFLEWFVKNPSFEEIKINYEIYKKGVGLLTSDWRMSEDDKYKIIIPKEEPTQECEHLKEVGCIKDICTCNTGTKQETLEEVNWKSVYEDSLLNMQKCSNAGYESKILELQEQIKRMYSEEDLKLAFFSGCQSERQIKPRIKCWEEWFRQFKKK